MGGDRGVKHISWEKVAANIAPSIYDCMGWYAAEIECWFTRDPNYNITKQENGEAVVRLMASQPN